MDAVIGTIKDRQERLMLPHVSVILAVFNTQRYVEEAIYSILRQGYTRFECIIVNDGSTDGSDKIISRLEKSDPRIRVIHQENRGLIASLNRAASVARGEYLARMDADDVCMPDRFEKQASFLDVHHEVAVLGGAVEFISESGDVLGRSSGPAEHAEIRRELLNRNPFWHPTVMMRRAQFLAAGGYRNVFAAEDLDLWLRMSEKFQVAILPDVVLSYRLHPDQITETRNRSMTLSTLAARGAAFARCSGARDPLDRRFIGTENDLVSLLSEIGPSVAQELSSKARSTGSDALQAFLRWLLQLADVNEPCRVGALDVLSLRCWREANRAVYGEAQYTSARICARAGRHSRTVLKTLSACRAQPGVIVRIAAGLAKGLRGLLRGLLGKSADCGGANVSWFKRIGGATVREMLPDR